MRMAAHTAPTVAGVFQSDPDKDYQQLLIERIAQGIEKANANLAPATVGWGGGRDTTQVFNRRWKMKPGTIPANPFGGTNDLVKMNPQPGSENLVEPAGPTDPEVALLAVHGLLHLMGYEDDTEAGASLMWSKQKLLLDKILGTGK